MGSFVLLPLLFFACAESPVSPSGPVSEPVSAPSSQPASGSATPKSAKDDGVVSGQIAPALSLPVVGDTRTWTLSEHVNTEGTGRSEGAVVAFMASWCGVCKNALPTLAELETQYSAQVAFVVVTTDTTDDKREQELDILRKGGIKAPLLAIDAPTQTAWLGSSQSIPRFVFVDKLGKVMVQDRGFGAKVKPLMPKQMVSLLKRAETVRAGPN